MKSRLLLAPAAVLLAIAVGGCGPDRNEYVAANEAIVDELPLFPGASELSRESMSYTFEDGGPLDAPEGYGTLVVYRVPEGTTEDEVLDFYATVAPDGGWRSHIEETPVIILDSGRPGSTPLADPTGTVYGDPMRQMVLCRGESHVSIDPANVERTGGSRGSTFDLYVDQSYAEEGWRTAC
jgi:hypothetical protein